jgi:hypothetical protein
MPTPRTYSQEQLTQAVADAVAEKTRDTLIKAAATAASTAKEVADGVNTKLDNLQATLKVQYNGLVISVNSHQAIVDQMGLKDLSKEEREAFPKMLRFVINWTKGWRLAGAVAMIALTGVGAGTEILKTILTMVHF